ncbi:fimbrial protein [Enterobacter cloacae]|uniref:fimbrial protein n=1 Tax=Enterobacter cloacae TaxID=550 RepID=UPI00101B18CF|nr:fimbrial protein [Enterobacter cloacae]QBC03413.1 hypothetical protein EWI30_15575 [Enterobacter cloacae]
MKALKHTLIASGLLFVALSLQNAWGYTYTCYSRTGTPNPIIANFGTYTITVPSENVPGQTFMSAATWSQSVSSHIRCDEPTTGNRYRYFSADSTLTPTTNDGHQWYYINEYLDSTVALNIMGAAHYVPFRNVRGGMANDAATNTQVNGGGSGKIDLRFKKAVMGSSSFENVHVADFYVTKSTTATSPEPVAQIFLSGTVVVPQNCVINAGTVISLDLGEMYSSDFISVGEKPRNVNAKSFNVPVSCNYGASLANLTLRVDGTPAASVPDALETTNPDVGVKIIASDGMTLRPADTSSAIPITLDMVDSDTYTTNVSLQAYPVSTTGLPPAEGTFTALAILRIDFA